MRVYMCLLVVVLAASMAQGQQRSCAVEANVVSLDPSSFSDKAAAESAWKEFLRHLDPNAAVLGYAIPDWLVTRPLWTPARGLPAQAFVARDKHHPIPIVSVETDSGPRRILFLVQNDKGTTATGRQIETVALRAILSKPRPEDSFALLTAGGPRLALPFGSSRDAIRAAVEELSHSKPTGPQGESVLDSLLEASTWFGSPRTGDSILLLARSLGDGRSGVQQIRSALVRRQIRLLTLGLGVMLQEGWDGLGVYTYSLNPLATLSEQSGGGWEEMGYLPRGIKAADSTLWLTRNEAEYLYGMASTFYVLRLDRTGPHVVIGLSSQAVSQLRWPRLSYPRPLPTCPPPAAAAPANGQSR